MLLSSKQFSNIPTKLLQQFQLRPRKIQILIICIINRNKFVCKSKDRSNICKHKFPALESKVLIRQHMSYLTRQWRLYRNEEDTKTWRAMLVVDFADGLTVVAENKNKNKLVRACGDFNQTGSTSRSVSPVFNWFPGLF